MRKKATISVKEDIWEEFKQVCEENMLLPSRVIEAMMNEFIQNLKEKRNTLHVPPARKVTSALSTEDDF